MSFNYRFSVIPAGAIIDERLTPRALQVLCLLGRHTNNQGWCTRSQVKMARELKCGRSTVQDAVELLVENGWVEKRANGRGARAPEDGEQPFAAYSYRVRLDRDDLPAALSGDDDGPIEPGGAGQPAGGAGEAAGGAGPEPAPLEGCSQGISSEPERDARARAREHEKFAKWLSAFKMAWPTAAADDQSRIANAARGLTDAERDEALAKIPAFLDFLKRSGRKTTPAGWKYLEEKRWTLLVKAEGQPASQRPSVAEESEQGRIWKAIYDIATRGQGIPYFMIGGSPSARTVTIPYETPDALVAMATDRSTWFDVLEDGEDHRFHAWRRWLIENVPNVKINYGPVGQAKRLRVPFDWPPRKDGTIGQSGDPPDQSSAA